MPDTKGGDRGAARPKPTRIRRNGYDSEDAFQKAAAAYLDAALPHGAWWCHVPNGGKRDLIAAANLKRMGTKAGAPDCLIIYAGRAHWIELKARYGGMKASQVATIPALTAAGSPVVIARTLTEIVSALETWGIPISPVHKALAERVDLSHTSKPTRSKPPAAATARKTATPTTPKTDLPQRMSAAQFKAVMGLSAGSTTKNEASWQTKLSAEQRTRFRTHAKPAT
jgi:hypothetical protein